MTDRDKSLRLAPARWTTGGFWFATAWGFAEATLFFLVPDVLLTRSALEHPKRAYVASLFALAGALVGGTLLFLWGGLDSESARSALDKVPGIRPDMLVTVNEQLKESGPIALFQGPPRGVPYKIYAIEWGALGGSLAAFLAYSVPARLLRFWVTAALAAALRQSALRKLSLAACTRIHAGFWLVFYAWYFYVMRG